MLGSCKMSMCCLEEHGLQGRVRCSPSCLADEGLSSPSAAAHAEGDFVLRNALVDWGGGLVQGWDVVFYGDSITEE